jgi:hypothetical protein
MTKIKEAVSKGQPLLKFQIIRFYKRINKTKNMTTTIYNPKKKF